MFNDKYGLTQAVLDGRKTMTRRIIVCPRKYKGEWVAGFYVCKNSKDEVTEVCMYDEDERMFDGGQILPKYEIGEVVAVAQSYKNIGYDGEYTWVSDGVHYHKDRAAGWANKMFVKVNLMPHHIEITGVKVERLQDISDEDCLKEGIVRQEVISDESPFLYAYDAFLNGDNKYFASRWFKNPKEAFAVLIDKVSGKGTWDSNPYVFAYEFKLVD